MLNMLRNELLLEDPNRYKNFLRMDNECFNKLLRMILPDIEKQNTKLRECISAEDRLAVTLRFLASGNSFRDLMFATRIHESTISLIIPEVCEAIISNLITEYIKLPTSAQEWKRVADEFNVKWDFPICLGALDGKHIDFEAPKSAGSFYYNYKGRNSIVLLGLTDANYKFLYVDVGVNGRVSDGGVFRESSLKKGIDRKILNFPEDSLCQTAPSRCHMS
ncbi:unnamed protein product [Callosobruchus maculatus]|uniref:DDE Tnp4 domain-containing protein n=1 Tax=Callosobruchus maculatus TaxID=64391 RepID=A0A653BKE3_CALMS|nr:unnamed protein product [Callosobruchus maculatus]